MKQPRKKQTEQLPEKVEKFNAKIRKLLDKGFDALTLLERIELDILHSNLFKKRRGEKCNIDQFNELKKLQ